jgi:predicted translin family RNA/ssDNA-binding protein
MSRNNRTIHVLLGCVAFLLGANLFVSLHQDRTARAAVFDPASQYSQQIVDQLTELNKKVDKLQSFMESGKMTVKVSELPKAEATK